MSGSNANNESSIEKKGKASEKNNLNGHSGVDKRLSNENDAEARVEPEVLYNNRFILDKNRNVVSKVFRKDKLKMEEREKKPKYIETIFVDMHKKYGHYLEPLNSRAAFERTELTVATFHVPPTSSVPSHIIPKQNTKKHLEKSKPKRTGKSFTYRRPPRRKRVKFPEDIVKEAEQKGETASKSRKVTRSKFKKSRRKSVQHTMGERVYIDEDLAIPGPIPSDSDDNECDCLTPLLCSFCETGEKLRLSESKNQIKLAKRKRKFSKKFIALEIRLQKILYAIAEYIDGNNTTVGTAEQILSVPAELKPKIHFNYLAASIWIFGFGIDKIYKNADDKEKQEKVQDLLITFGKLAEDVDRVTRRTYIYSNLHYTFGTKAMKKLAKTSLRLSQKIRPSELKVQKPKQLRKALDVTQTTTTDENYKILVSKIQEEENQTAFSSEPFQSQYDLLFGLLVQISAQLIEINSQMKFLADDIVEGRFYPNDQVFFTVINSFDLTMYRFVALGESEFGHLEILQRMVRRVLLDVYTFIQRGEKVIRGIIEMRDMVELTCAHINSVLPWDIHNYLRSSSSKGINYAFKRDKLWKRILKCSCLTFRKGRFRSNGFNPTEFYQTIYPNVLTQQKIRIRTSGCDIILGKKPNRTTTTEPKKSSEPDKTKRINHESIDNLPTLHRIESLEVESTVWDELENTKLKTLKEKLLDLN